MKQLRVNWGRLVNAPEGYADLLSDATNQLDMFEHPEEMLLLDKTHVFLDDPETLAVNVDAMKARVVAIDFEYHQDESYDG